MSETPLSNLIAAHVAAHTHRSFVQFVEAFRGSMLGVIAEGVPATTEDVHLTTTEQPVSIGLTRHANGKIMVLAFADAAAFARRYGARFNAEIIGESLLATVLINPECEGVLVNSALAEVSVVIDRATAESVTRTAASPTTKPW